jgi:signal transduction histidine kinase
MVVQAGAARRIAETDPPQARAALASIERTGRQALVEMRRLLGVLRTDTRAPEPRTPQPSLAHIDALIDTALKAGLDVAVKVEGSPRPLPTAVDLSAYRIVQEALTNCIKHAGRARADVRVRYGEHEVRLEVADNGPGVRAPRDPDRTGGGQGLIGMRERVALFGGQLEVGPRPGGGFRVSASLPFDGAGPE